MSRPNQVEVVCQVCGAQFTVKLSDAEGRRFCSVPCFAAGKRGKNNPAWAGGTTEINGYVGARAPDHPRANQHGYVYEHILVAERAIGKPLPPQADIHHVNERRKDNRPANLVICENQEYHALLHVRTRVLRAGGNPSRDKICGRCKRPRPREEFYAAPSSKDGRYGYCRDCARDIARAAFSLRRERKAVS